MRQYFNTRLYNIWIDGGPRDVDPAPDKTADTKATPDFYMSAEAFETDVMRLLTYIHGTVTGQAVVEAIFRTNGFVLIVPERTNERNASASNRPNAAVAPPGNNFSLVRFSPAALRLALLTRQPELDELRRKMNSPFRFIELIGVDVDQKLREFDNSGFEPELILLHELIHSLRQIRRVADSKPVDDEPLLTSEEEFFCILISNVFASELGRPEDLRRDHAGAIQLPDDQKSSAGFLNVVGKSGLQYRRHLVLKLIGQMPDMTQVIRQAPAAFNPFDQFLGIGVLTGLNLNQSSRLPAPGKPGGAIF